jgi:hypothetical protein
MAAAAPERAKGFILVLVVDEAAGGNKAIARVCRDYAVDTTEALERDVRRAAWQAGNQLALGDAAVRVLGDVLS